MNRLSPAVAGAGLEVMPAGNAELTARPLIWAQGSGNEKSQVSSFSKYFFKISRREGSNWPVWVFVRIQDIWTKVQSYIEYGL